MKYNHCISIVAALTLFGGILSNSQSLGEEPKNNPVIPPPPPKEGGPSAEKFPPPVRPWIVRANQNAADHKKASASIQAALTAIASDEELNNELMKAAESGDSKALMRNPRMASVWGEGCIPRWEFGKLIKDGDVNGNMSKTRIPVKITIEIKKIKITVEFEIGRP